MTGGSGHKRKSTERRQFIVEYLRKFKHVDVSYLSEALQVSEVTIRKDLDKLEEERILIRNHGGASLNENLFFEPTFMEKEVKLIAEKRAIAQEAARLVASDMMITLSTGTTVGQMTELIRDRAGLTVVTNAVNIVHQLVHAPNIHLFVTGGHIRPSTYALIGEAAVRSLKDICSQYAFIGTNGVDLTHGITTPSAEEAEVVRQVIVSAQKTVLLADHSKFGHVAYYRVCPIDKIDIVITDDGTPEQFLKPLQDRGIEVIVVRP